MRVPRIFETCLYASDLHAAERFYRDVLGLTLVTRMGDRGLTFRCGAGVLLIFDPARTRVDASNAPRHGAEGPGHVAFWMDEGTIDEWRAHLAERGVEIESEVDWPAGGRSLYFRDPAGNSLELAPPTLWGFDPNESE